MSVTKIARTVPLLKWLGSKQNPVRRETYQSSWGEEDSLRNLCLVVSEKLLWCHHNEEW